MSVLRVFKGFGGLLRVFDGFWTVLGFKGFKGFSMLLLTMYLQYY